MSEELGRPHKNPTAKAVITIEAVDGGMWKVHVPGSEPILCENISTIVGNIGNWCEHMRDWLAWIERSHEKRQLRRHTNEAGKMIRENKEKAT